MIKFTEAKTTELKRVINMLDMIKRGSTLKSVKVQSVFSNVDLSKVRTFKAAKVLLMAEYEVLAAKEDEIIVIETPVIESEPLSEIDKKVAATPGTWVKHRNLRKKLIEKHNDPILLQIEQINKEIRALISRPEQEKRNLYRLKSILVNKLSYS